MPFIRETIETLLIKVKAVLAANNCASAFLQENLRNRNLHNEDILTQVNFHHRMEFRDRIFDIRYHYSQPKLMTMKTTMMTNYQKMMTVWKTIVYQTIKMEVGKETMKHRLIQLDDSVKSIQTLAVRCEYVSSFQKLKQNFPVYNFLNNSKYFYPLPSHL